MEHRSQHAHRCYLLLRCVNQLNQCYTELITESSIKLPTSKPYISHYETSDGAFKSIEVWYVGMTHTHRERGRVKDWNQTEQSTTKPILDWSLVDTSD